MLQELQAGFWGVFLQPVSVCDPVLTVSHIVSQEFTGDLSFPLQLSRFHKHTQVELGKNFAVDKEILIIL